MGLFPSRSQCLRNIRRFPEKDAEALSEIWGLVDQSIQGEGIPGLQSKLVLTLKRWQAFRNQRSPGNEEFLQELFANPQTAEAFAEIVEKTRSSMNLRSILASKEAVETVYGFLKGHMLRNGIPARIVTVSKGLLMLAGFTPGLDSVVLKALKKSNPDLLACAGVWPFCLYWEALEFIASEQEEWERMNGPLSHLADGIPIGQLMDRILWRAS